MKKPEVVVLILSYNGKSLLDEVIASYRDNDFDNFEIAVIDNGSVDGSREYVEEKYPFVKVLRTEKNLGYSGGVNLGLDYAFNIQEADYAIISNNDLKVNRETISEMVKVTRDFNDAGFVIGKIYYYDMPDVIQTIGLKYDEINWVTAHDANRKKDSGAYDFVEERYYSDDIVMLVKKDVYKAIGGYDTSIRFQAEQFDWQIRGKKAGFKIYYTPFAKAWHRESFTIGKSSPFKTYYDVRNSFVVRLKHRDKFYLRKYFKKYIRKNVLRKFFRYLVRFKFKYAYSIMSAFISALIWGIKNKKIGLNGFK
jgi:GT2 family glycosyltransferase